MILEFLLWIFWGKLTVITDRFWSFYCQFSVSFYIFNDY